MAHILQIHPELKPVAPLKFTLERTFAIGTKMKLRTQHKPLRCPWCGSDKIALMLNGMPVFIPELEGVLENDGVLGRSRPKNDQPTWQCTECYAQFYRDNEAPFLPQDGDPPPAS